MNIIQDKIRGSLIGGAIGDALGYPVEFIYSFEGIQARYGERGITRLDVYQHWLGEEEQTGKAVVSDDTQMTLYTANGLLNAMAQNIPLKQGICMAYIEWYLTQVGKKSGKYHDCWVGDEALAIALYCALKHFDNFEEAVIAAVNHAGDSDSTGAVTGNILGAAVGYEAIPQYFKDDLEMHDLILHMADDLYRGEVTLM